MKAVESEGLSCSVPLPTVLIKIQVTANTKMLDETVQAYLQGQRKLMLNKIILNTPRQMVQQPAAQSRYFVIGILKHMLRCALA